ncbi:hypothetical protein AVMA1855_20025 [Acidovorax sp. SUPP1855]|uniref:hypothetical protein n=1 Tax=Acidovorax sp. SUPP1855 TaxID=431774 RepID=UPI0023DE5672|nr:hypothetical protein [Acidovorax sp. SUPP1855]GKS86479.1 hypothetical protein AVMA1855_20025 [Acidovorax sp. SUPP1855]
MSFENATFINQLNVAWPLAADLISEGDDHIRLTKATLKNTFPNVAGAVSASHIELSYVTGVTSGIQGQINGKGAITGQTWSGAHVFGGTVTLPAATTVGTVTAAEIAYLSGVTSGIQAQFTGKASLSGATYTGAHNYSGASAVTLPANTSIGTVTAAELGYLDNVTSDIQGQFAGKASKAGDTYSGIHDFTSAVVRVPTLAAGSAGSKAASLDFVNAAAFSAVLPGQAGNAGKVITSDGTNASWTTAIPTLTIPVLFASSLNGGQFSGTRNKSWNGAFLINQRVVSGSVALASNSYGHDGWKAGPGGCTYTFSTTGGVVTLTISAGTLLQVVDGDDLETGTHVLSWVGTSQGRIAAGAYSASGVTASVTGGTSVNIEFGTGTLSLVQFEKGSTATAFERRRKAEYLRDCERYLQKSFDLAIQPRQNLGSSAGAAVVTTQTSNAQNFTVDIPFKTRMKSAPSLITYNPFAAGAGFSASGIGDYAASIYSTGEMGATIRCMASVVAAQSNMSIHWMASCEP